MSVFKKLSKARVMLQQVEMTKSGNNKFAGYKYFELADFMPHINRIFDELGLVGVVSYTNELATLNIYDIDGGEPIVITSPMAEATLKGCHPVQNLGAAETYQRRYLWVTALEIVEHDALDSSEPVKQVDLTDFQSALESATDQENLVKIWRDIPKEHQNALKETAAQIKARLS